MLNRFVALTVLGIILSLSIALKLKKNSPPTEDSIAESSPAQLPVKRNVKNVNRLPASQKRYVQRELPSFVNNLRNDGRFERREEIDNTDDIKPQVASSFPSQAEDSTPPVINRTDRPNRSSRRSESGKADTTAAPVQMITSTPLPIVPPNRIPIPGNGNSSDDGDDDSDSGSNDGESGDNEEITCSANIGSGSYSYSFNVSLTCSAAASIKYCISENTCCDPETAGVLYSGPVLVNPGTGDYCLSFVGTANSDGTLSTVVNKSYTFNPALPDVLVSNIKRYFQTTELEGEMSMTSLDFGVPGMYAGVINLKNNDPGISGMGWSCGDILNDHATLGSNYVMADTDVSGFSSSSQFDIFLRTTNLSYGNNYLTTYVQNRNFVEPVTGCNTERIVLEDFEYFDPTPYHGLAGTNDIREFSGGFTHLGFFEPEATVYRGPAGENTETVSSQELNSNLFGIFY